MSERRVDPDDGKAYTPPVRASGVYLQLFAAVPARPANQKHQILRFDEVLAHYKAGLLL